MEDSIIVTVPKGFAQLMLGGAALLCLVPVGFALAGELPPVGAVIFALLIAPFVIAGVLWPRFRVVVRQGLVTVRPLSACISGWKGARHAHIGMVAPLRIC